MAIPMKLSAADRRRPTLGDGLVALVVAAAALLLFFHLRPESGNFLSATVVLDSEIIARYDLSALTQPETLVVDDCPYPLRIQVEPGRIRVEESGCPGADCVHTGWADQAGEQIICLPNRLVISLSGNGDKEIDAVTG